MTYVLEYFHISRYSKIKTTDADAKFGRPYSKSTRVQNFTISCCICLMSAVPCSGKTASPAFPLGHYQTDMINYMTCCQSFRKHTISLIEREKTTLRYLR